MTYYWLLYFTNFSECSLDCSYCYSQQIISTVANEFLVPYNLIQRAPETKNLQYCNTEYHFKPNQKNIKYISVFTSKDFVSYYLSTWNYAHILSNLKTINKAKKTFWIRRDIFLKSSYISNFCSKLAFPCFARLKFLILFCKFQCLF